MTRSYTGPLERFAAGEDPIVPVGQGSDSGQLKSSGVIAPTAGLAISDEPGMLQSVTINFAVAATTLTIYDNASAASGTVLFKVADLQTVNRSPFTWTPPRGVHFKNGLFAVLTGAASEAVVYFSN